VAARGGQRERHGAGCRFDLEATNDTARRNLRHPALHVGGQRRDASKDASGQHRLKHLAAHAEPCHDGCGRRGELAGRARKNVTSDGIARPSGFLYDISNPGDDVPRQTVIVYGLDHLSR